VLNPFNQAHDVKNVFVMDGASFVSSACQNPTLSMMAVTVRACANLIDRFRKSEV
jgi:choline dehydrogenase-like flavoprotein